MGCTRCLLSLASSFEDKQDFRFILLVFASDMYPHCGQQPSTHLHFHSQFNGSARTRTRSDAVDRPGRLRFKRKARDRFDVAALWVLLLPLTHPYRHFVPLQLSRRLSSRSSTETRLLSFHLSLPPSPTLLTVSRAYRPTRYTFRAIHSTSPHTTQDNLCRFQWSLRTGRSAIPSSPSRGSQSLGKSTRADEMNLEDRLQRFSDFYEEQTSTPSISKKPISILRKPRRVPSLNKADSKDSAVVRSRSEQESVGVVEEMLLLARVGGRFCVERLRSRTSTLISYRWLRVLWLRVCALKRRSWIIVLGMVMGCGGQA